MFCPQCSAEYLEGITECAECKIALVATLPEKEVFPDRDLVSVFETADSALLPVVKSLLDAAQIPYMVQGEESLGLLPLGNFGTGMTVNARGMSAIVYVPGERAVAAEELLAEIEVSATPDDQAD